MRLTRAEVKLLRSLSQKKVRDQEKRFLLEGWKPIREAVDAGAEIDLAACLADAHSDPEHADLLSALAQHQVSLRDLTAIELRQISDTVHAQGIVAVVRQRVSSLEDLIVGSPPVIVACDEVNDPGNLGTVIRCCDWFGADRVLLSQGTVSLYNEKVVRATAGSMFHVQVASGSDLATDLRWLHTNGYHVVVTAADGDAAPAALRANARIVIVLGSEAHGVRPEIRALADTVVAIPRSGRAESLNVGVSCGILLAAWRGI